MVDMTDYLTDKKLVAKNFNYAVNSYDGVAVLQQKVAARMMERLELIKIDPQIVLDLGSGTGMAAKTLSKTYPKARLIQADIAYNMLSFSRLRFPRFFSRQSYACIDAENLAIANSKVGMVFSNMMLQWCSDTDQVFNETKRVLRTGGIFIFSTLGPNTLTELRQSWLAADAEIHVNAFIDMHDIGDALVRAGFELPVMEVEHFTLTYEDVFVLMRELKLLGSHNINQGRRRTMTGKGRIKSMLNAYESFRSDGKLPASYEVIYGHAWRPAVTIETQNGSVTATFPISGLKVHKNKF